jgi:hypothetical protein
MVEPEHELCIRQCKYHDDLKGKVDNTVAKSSVKWIATMFLVPTIGIIFWVWAFISSADYRYASMIQQQINVTNIKLQDERMSALRMEVVNSQTALQSDLTVIKTDLREFMKEIRARNP